jgi:hypothetical protein
VNGMNVDKMGICVAMIVLVAVLGAAAVSSGYFDIGVGEINLPQINAGTNTNNDGFYEYCYKFNIENC